MTGPTMLKTMLLGIGLVASATMPALAQKGLDEPFQGSFKEALAGKTVAYVPVAMNFDLTEGWFAGLKKELEPFGVKVVVRDANWSTNAGAQAVTTLISEKPAAIVVHNPDVQTYAKLLQRAESEGIYIIQINMGSNYRSSAFVGANWIEIGERDTQAVVDYCKGKSNKIAVVQGALSAAASAYTLKGVENVLAKNPDIKVVSSQAADWDAAKAKAITQTVLKQNPDLCGIVGFWDGMDIGTAAAVKEAGPDRQGVRRDLRRRRTQGRLRPRQVGRVRPRPQLRRADPGRANGRHDQVADLVGREARFRQGIGIYHADSDHQGERGKRHRVLESRRPEEIAGRRGRPRIAAAARRLTYPPLPASTRLAAFGRSSFTPRTADAGRTSSFAISLLARPPARRDPVQALDRNRDPGDRAVDRQPCC